jgi:hypothetical protein
VGLVLLHGFLGRFEDSHCSAMVAFLLELGRILGEARKDFYRFEGELARSLCASHMVGVDVDWSACALKRSSEHERACSQQVVLGSRWAATATR